MARSYEFVVDGEEVRTTREARVRAYVVLDCAIGQDPGPIGMQEYVFGMSGQHVSPGLAQSL